MSDSTSLDNSDRPRNGWKPTPIELVWWGVLIVSVLVGFGMTIFAPT